MAKKIYYDNLEKILIEFVERARNGLKDRWNKWKIDLSKNELYEVVGGLLARQVTLSTQFALAPSIWNGHIAPIFLRCMVDVYINLAWILKEESLTRSKMFIKYGLGQLKLEVEHRRNQIMKDGLNPDKDPALKANEELLNYQRLSFLTEISLGKWAEMNTREMAIDAECIDFYRYSYSPFSATIHSMWHHLCRYNFKYCKNPLHKYHRVPFDLDLEPDLFYLCIAAKNLEKTFSLFDKKFNIKCDLTSIFEFICEKTGLKKDK